jgi:hypothetical protein
MGKKQKHKKAHQRMSEDIEDLRIGLFAIRDRIVVLEKAYYKLVVRVSKLEDANNELTNELDDSQDLVADLNVRVQKVELRPGVKQQNPDTYISPAPSVTGPLPIMINK